MSTRSQERTYIQEDANGWALDDAYRLDDVRAALRAGDLAQAARLAGRVYRLTPVVT